MTTRLFIKTLIGSSLAAAAGIAASRPDCGIQKVTFIADDRSILEDGKWHYMTACYHGDDVTWWIDGVEQK